MKTNPTIVKFYAYDGELIEACTSYTVPRPCEYINIGIQRWLILHVEWALDKRETSYKLRASVRMKKVGPARLC